MSKFLTNIDLQKNQITNVAIHNISNGSIISPVVGQIIYDSDGKIKFWNGSGWETSSVSGLNIIPTTGTLDLAAGKTLDVNNTITLNSIDGSVIYFNGGGGGQRKTTSGVSPGAANSGTGGDGGTSNSAANMAGGSGIVIVRYPGTVAKATGGTITYINDGFDYWVVHTFTTSGTFTIA